MPNTSATGGPLQPAVPPAPAPLEGQAFLDFLQAWLVNLSGIDGTLVRPRWQTDPPNIPPAATAWMAFGVTDRKADKFPYIKHVSTGDGYDELHRHETFIIQCSFYDTGSGGQADANATLVRDNSAIPQNREYLDAQNCSLIETGEIIPVPVLVKQRWLNRFDLDITLRREIVRQYPVLNVLEAAGTIQTDSASYKTKFDTPVVPT